MGDPGAWGAGGLGGWPGGMGAWGHGRGARGPGRPGWHGLGARGPGGLGARRGLGGRPGGLGGPGAWGLGAARGLGARRGQAGPGGGWGAWAGRPGRHPCHHAVARGGNCNIRATTRRRHAVKQLLMLQNPPPARVAGTTRTRGHDTNRTAQPRCLGAAATTAASPAEPSRAQPWLRRASRGPSLRCPDAPSHGPATQLVERVPPPGDNTSG